MGSCGSRWMGAVPCLTPLPEEMVQPKQEHRWAGEVGPGMGMKGPFSCSWLHLSFLMFLQDTPWQQPSPTLP